MLSFGAEMRSIPTTWMAGNPPGLPDTSFSANNILWNQLPAPVFPPMTSM